MQRDAGGRRGAAGCCPSLPFVDREDISANAVAVAAAAAAEAVASFALLSFRVGVPKGLNRKPEEQPDRKPLGATTWPKTSSIHNAVDRIAMSHLLSAAAQG